MSRDLVDRIAGNLKEVQRRIEEAASRAGRSADAVRLVAVTKSASDEAVRALYDLGLREFAENRLENALPRISRFPDDIHWHWIAPIQRRKARDIAAHFHCVDAIDRIEVAEALDQRAAEAGKVIPVLIEVNVSGEASKHGFGPEGLTESLPRIQTLPHLAVRGLMTMAPFGAGETELRHVFGGLRILAETQVLPELSMGMSEDFEIAIESGATQIRVGSILFA